MKNAFPNVALAAALLLIPAQAQATSHYQPWTNLESTAADNRLKGFVDRLNAIIKDAEAARAADPRLLRDLKALADDYRRPQQRQLLGDDFGDGDFIRNPAWTVTQGKYSVEPGWGLRSYVKMGAEQQPLRGKDAAAIFGQILQQALDPEGRSSTTSGSGGAAAPAAIRTDFRLSNAFAVSVELSSWVRDAGTRGRMEIAATQGSASYVLAYGQGGTWELLRRTNAGTRVLGKGQTGQALEDKNTHKLVWSRLTDGLMTVSVDGRETLKATDQGFRDAFDGLALINRGGDYIVKHVAVFGTQ